MATESNRFGITLGLKSEKSRAAEIGVSAIMLYHARKRGELACVKIGDRVLYSAAQIAEWLALHEQSRKVS